MMIGFTDKLHQEIARLRSRERELFDRIDDYESLLTTERLKNWDLQDQVSRLRKDLFEAQSRANVIKLPVYEEVQPV